jgi:hypothetical protein
MSRSSGSLELSQENETLEEDMRKAKESAELLRSVVLPLEEEISNLKKNLELSQKKNLEYEQHLLGNVSITNSFYTLKLFICSI